MTDKSFIDNVEAEEDYEVLVYGPKKHMDRNVRKRTFWHVRPTKTQNSMRIRAVWSVFFVRMKKPLHTWPSKRRLLRILIRLRECAGWSESSMGVHVWSTLSDVAAHKCPRYPYSVQYGPEQHWQNEILDHVKCKQLQKT